MKHTWNIHSHGRVIATGTVEAADEREAIGMVLLDEGEGKEPDTSYRIVVGETSMSSYGDEFRDSARMVGTESELDEPLPVGPSIAGEFDLPGADHRTSCEHEWMDTYMPTQLGPAGKFCARCGKTIMERKGTITEIEQEAEFGTTEEFNIGDMITIGDEPFIVTRVDRSLDRSSSSVTARRAKDFGTITGRMSHAPAAEAPSEFVPDDTYAYVDGTPGSAIEHMRKTIDGAPGWTSLPADEVAKAADEMAKLTFPRRSAQFFPDSSKVISRKPSPLDIAVQGMKNLQADAQIKKAWINDEQIYPPIPTMAVGEPSIICECKSMIGTGHLPVGLTTGIPCPGCDRTYSYQRDS